MLQGYTDYPIKKFGDEYGFPAPMRKCCVLQYDMDKYCHIVVFDNNMNNFIFLEVKRGYIYSTEEIHNPMINEDYLDVDSLGVGICDFIEFSKFVEE